MELIMAHPEQLKMLKRGVEVWNDWREENPATKIDLQEANLGSTILRRANLQMADLRKANLEGTDLQEANLANANLYDAGLREASLRKTNFHNADLSLARLQGAILIEADLTKASLIGAEMADAMLNDANLREANLQEALLHRTNLSGSVLQEIELRGADLRESNVRNVKYNKLGLCRGIRLDGCYGSPRFVRDAKDNEFVEEFQQNHKYLWALWSVSSDCGRSIWRWVGWSVLFAVLFAIAFAYLGPEHFQINFLPADNGWHNLINMTYYSVVSFTTLGFGDIVPKTHLAAVLVMLEVILGYVMLGGLISIMATKLARRAA